MRLHFWQADETDDSLDPELLSIFGDSPRSAPIEPTRMASGRLRVAAMLRPEPAATGWFGRRLAYGIVGGSGLWASLIGTAAAHKAAAVVIGIGVLLAGGATAEVTGIGPAVREAVSPAHSSDDAVVEATERPERSEAGDSSDAPAVGTAVTEGAGATVTEAPDELPGNLTTQVRPNGGFTLRGVLVAASDTTVTVQTSVDDVPLTFELNDADIKLPGSGKEQQQLGDFEGHLAVIIGTCETVDAPLTEDCAIERITVLGNAGQNGQSEPSSNASSNANQRTGEDDEGDSPQGPPDHANAPDDDDVPKGVKPDPPGQSDDD